MNNHKKIIINELIHNHKEKFKSEPQFITLAPGRINLIGEHTDYNFGLAIPAAINRWVVTGILNSKNQVLTVYSINFSRSIKILSNIIKKDDEIWIKLIKTIIITLKKDYGYSTHGFLTIGGNLPIGCGLSSSTAFIISILYSICSYFSINIEKKKMVFLAQKIENTALGLSGGLLDQYGIVYSKKNSAILIDFKFNKIKYLPIKIDNTSWIVINSNIKRELSNSKYIERIHECNQGLKILKNIYKIIDFRDINIKMIETLTSNMILYNRLYHYIYENQRVLDMKKYLINNNSLEIGKILTNSHQSLQYKYQVSCNEIDYIIEISKTFKGWLGGRIIGGGFGGCSIHLIEKNKFIEYKKYIINNYYNKYNLRAEIYKIKFLGGIENVII